MTLPNASDLAEARLELLAKLLQAAYQNMQGYPAYAELLAALPSLTAEWDDLSDFDKNFRREVAEYLLDNDDLLRLTLPPPPL